MIVRSPLPFFLIFPSLFFFSLTSRRSATKATPHSLTSFPRNAAVHNVIALPTGLEGQEDLRKVLLTVIQNHDQAEAEKRELAEKNEALADLIVKHEKRHEALKMQIRFKESHIARLRKGAASEERDEIVAQLHEEVEILQKQVQHHPDAKRFSLESRDLRAELKQVKAMYDVDGHNLALQAVRTRMLELEQCLREQLTAAIAGDSNSGASEDEGLGGDGSLREGVDDER